MDLKTFESWYSIISDRLRPLEPWMAAECFKHSICAYCPIRAGCPMRPMFYLKDLHFEIHIQKAEIHLCDTLGSKYEDEGDRISNSLRRKRTDELNRHPDYSFK